MKKTKTIISSLLIMLATAFLSACSCSGDKTDNLPQVPVNTISITSDYEGAVRDEETGFLNIDCIYGDEFNITYKLGPDNTTRTQVDWDFDGRDDVVASKRNYYTYSQGTTHTISFVTKSAGTTIIKFKPRGTDKWTQANIQVSTPKSSWPTFVAPTGLDYNPTTGKVTWNPVEKMTVGSTIVNVEKNNGQIVGLTGYLVNYKNLTTGEEYSTPSNQPIAQCEFELPRGYTYMINVSAKGNNFSHNDSLPSDNFKFHQLANATELSNDSGKISFKTPAFADINEVYYNKNDSSNIKISSSGTGTCTFYANQKFSSLNEYNVYVISYPKDYALAKQEGKNYVLDESTGVRYYPSVKTDTLTIQNLVAPTISMTPVQGVQEIAIQGTTFTFGENVNNVNNPYLSSQLNWEISGKSYSQVYGVKYSYAIYKGDTKILPTGDGYITTNGSKEKEDISLDLKTLRKNPGSYRIEIFACGNSTNTIPSQKTELAFTVLNAMDTTTTINEKEILQTNIANSNLFGVELYFINKTGGTFNLEKSVYKYFDAKNSVTNAYDRTQLFIDISDGKLKLAPGTYDIYGRFVGINNGTYNLSVTSDVAKINSNDVVIAPPVASASLSSQGVLTFEKVEDYTDYILDFTHNKNNKTINFSKVITPADYILNTNDNKKDINLDIYKIFSEYLSNEHSTENVGEFTSDCNISFTIKTVGKDDGVNAKATNSIEFSRLKMVNLDSVTLENYKLSFNAPAENNSPYKISINGYVYTTSETKKGTTTIDLKTAVGEKQTKDENNQPIKQTEKLADVVNTSSSTEITIWASGSPANLSNPGSLDSFEQTQSFKCTETPSDLEMQENETLLWNLSEKFEDAQIFTLRFYTQNRSGGWELAKTVELNSGIDSLTSEEEGVLGKYSYNIAGAIDELASDTTIAITVQHIMSDRFSNVESNKYYVVKLSSVELSYAMSDGNPAIGFTTLNTSGLTYELSITKDGGTPNTLTYTELTFDTLLIKDGEWIQFTPVANAEIYELTFKMVGGSDVISKQIKFDGTKVYIANIDEENSITWTEDVSLAKFENSLVQVKFTKEFLGAEAVAGDYTCTITTICTKIIKDDLAITEKGNYVLSLYASSIPTGTNTETNPFILGSTSNTLTINIISSQIQAYADGEFVKWNAIHDDATYKLAYKVNGSSDYVEVAETFTKDNCKYNVWSILASGTNQVKVTPSIDYETTGCILSADEVLVCDIVKLDTVSSISTSNGKLTYTLSDDSLVDYSLYVYAGSTKLSSDSYIIDYTNKEITILSSSLVGEKAYALQIVQKEKVNAETGEVLIIGKINSDISSTYNATKIEAVSDLTKIGEWIQFTPVANAKIYELTFKMVGGSDVVSKQIKFDGTKVYIANIGEDNSITWTEDVNLAKFENSLVQVKFTNEFLGTEAVAGDYTYTITPYTTISGFLNGNTSSPLTITKLSNAITIGVENESITLSGYQPAGTNSPTSIAYEISRYELETTTIGEGEEQQEVTNKVIKSTKSGTLTYAGDIETQITTDGSSYKLNLNDLGIFEAGNYQISLVFVGNGNEIISSEPISNEVAFEKLASSSLSTINGVLSWSKIDSATSYTLKITCDVAGSESEGESETTTTNEWLFNITPASADNPQVTEEDLKIDETQTFKFEIGKTYKVEVMSNGAGKLSSAWSEVFEVKKLQAPTNIKISATTNKITYTDSSNPEDPKTIQVNIGDPMLTWSDPNGVANRLNYAYTLDGNETLIYNTVSGSTELLGQLLPTNLAKGVYEIKMKTIGNTISGSGKIGLLTSDYSSSDSNPNANYVTESTSVGFSASGTETIKFGTFGWTPVEGAYGYKLTFFEGMNSLKGTKVYTTYTTSNSYTFRNTEFDGSGYYTVLVNAITDPSIAIVSTYSESSSESEEEIVPVNTSSLYKAPSVSNLMVQDGMFAWGLKINDIKAFLKPHATIAGDTLLEKFEIAEDPNKESALFTKTIDYITKKINNKIEGDVIPEVDEIISTLFKFKGTINGYEQEIIPTSVKKETIGSDELLMFSLDLTVAPGVYPTNKFTLNVVPQGNYSASNDKGLISSVDGRYSGDGQTAYKPNTPSTWGVEQGAIQISEGKLLWTLVTTEDFAKSGTTHEQKYHYEYKITAVTNDQETKISNTINVSDTIDGGTNTNLSDDCYYYRYLKNDLFALSGSNAVSTNTNYNLEISVVGTKDSTLLGEGEKAYLNSNVFSYTEPMNILENHESYVRDGEYTYIPCANMSTATKVVVYGPFTDASGEPIYAPDSTDAKTWKVNNVVYPDYKSALIAWKNAIQDTWNIITKTEGRTTEETELRNKLRHEYLYEEEIDSSGETITTSRQTTLNLTGQEDYLAGSYIIRKQEIGNRKGIIDTDFTETLIKADGNNFEYEQIATKLDKTSKIGSIWVKDGKFEWNEVPRANAYKIYVEKVDKDGNQVKKSDNIVVYTNSYEMLEDIDFNDSNYFYRITITATHIESDGKTISPNYFEGESVQTDKYGRASIPQELSIDKNGTIKWNVNVDSSGKSGYEVRINSEITKEANDPYYDLTLESNGEFTFSVRSRGDVGTDVAYLNSCYTEEIYITKLPTPILKIENGVFKWGTDSSGEIGQQPTTTKFKLNDGDPQILDINTGSYLLHTEITSFDLNYSATIDNQKYPSTNVFKVKYQGTSGEVTDTQKHFVVASSEQSLTATKLGYPILKNVDVQVGANTSENRIRWDAVANAQGYRAVVITKITNSAGEKEDKIFDSSYIIGNTNTFFVQNDDGTFDLKLTPVINELGITSTDGISLKVYVQAIGTIDSTTLSGTDNKYVSGCFSDVQEVTIPSDANNITFDANTGILRWNFVDENAVSQGFNIKLTTQYTVTGVSQKDFDDYWKVTSDSYKNNANSITTTNSNPTGRASDIKNRSISYTSSTSIDDGNPVNTYSIEVIDVIFLYYKIVNDYKVTPTSYQLTNIGTNYTFTVVVMNGEEGYNGKYVSNPVSLTGTNEKPIKFALFTFGDGTELLPYGVSDVASLNNIRYFLDRHFVITNDISLKNITLERDSSKNWEMIDGTFTGSIDGNNYTISAVKPSVSSDTLTMSAIMKENAGVIKNLNITIHSENSGTTSNSQNVEIAGLAIKNSGTIENVHISKYFVKESTNSEISAIYSNTALTKVAGMTVYNSGIISNSSVEINITGLDTNYIVQGNNTTKSSLVAGITNINTGSILNTFFNGNITGNYLSGIANESSGTISNCYALGIAYVTDSDANTDDGDGGKNIQFGGIAGSIYGTSTIENCYSRMIISVKILSSSGDIFASIGGIVGQIENKKDSNNQDINNVINISNCYVVFKAELTQGSFGTGNVNVLAPYKANDDENTYNYSGNFYLEESITENITVNKPTNVATDSGSVSGLASQMTELKDAENNAIYTNEIGSETQTSKYPLLVSNPEKNPDVQSKTA